MSLPRWIMLGAVLAVTLSAGMDVRGDESALALVKGGAPVSTIVLAKEPTRAAQFAARELQYHVRKITGAELPIVADDAAVEGRRILVGASAATEALGLRNDGFAPQEYLVRVGPEAIVLMGRDKDDKGKVNYSLAQGADDSWPPLLDDQATCYAVYDFLERSCGVRWYWPTEAHMVLEPTATLAVVPVERRRSPSYKYRWPCGQQFPDPLWAATTTPSAQLGVAGSLSRCEASLFWRRMRVGGEKFAANHTFGKWAERYNESHPDWYGVGQPKGAYAQPCMSNPEVVAQCVQEARDYFDKGIVPTGGQCDGIFFGVVPNDNGAWCGCATCQARLTKNESGMFSNSSAGSLVHNFVNKIAKELRTTHPDNYISTLAYWDYAFPPADVALEPNIAVMLCLHIRNWWEPAMEKNDMAFVEAWAGKRDRPIYLWLYDCFPQEIAMNGRFHCFPAFMPHLLARQLRTLRGYGARGVFLNGFSWYTFEGDYRYKVARGAGISPAEQLHSLVMFKMLDDPDQDVDAVLDEFFTRYYGAAAAPMKELCRQLEDTYCSSVNYPPEIQRGEKHVHQTEEIAWKWLGTQERMEAWATLMRQAVAAAQTDTEKAHVDLFAQGVWDYMVAGRKLYLDRLEMALKNIPSELWVEPQASTVDGDAKAVDWKQAAVVALWRTPSGDPVERAMELRVAHDGRFLYLRGEEVVDPTTLVTGCDPESGDCWQMLLTRRCGAPLLRVAMGVDGGCQTFVTGGADMFSWNGGVKVVSDTGTPGKWALYAALPLDKLLPGGMKPGWQLYANFIRSTPKGEHFLWRPMPQGFRDPDGLGVVGLE